jgi:5-methylcytosine-specific restriction endonuclease McrA
MPKTKEERTAYHREWYLRNRDAVKARTRAYALENSAAVKARAKDFRAENKERLKAERRAYYEAHRQDILAQQKAYNAGRAETLREYKAQWWQANRDAQRQRKRERWAQHREELAQKQRARYAKSPEAQKKRTHAYYRANRSEVLNKAKTRVKAWSLANRERRLESFARRRALKKATQTERIDFSEVLRSAYGKCGICREPFDLFGIEFDHIVPLAKGGTHTRHNLQATHARCNRSKGAKVA